MKPQAENRIRNMDVAQGGKVQEHFAEYLFKPWHVMALDIGKLDGSWDSPGDSFNFITPKCIAQGVGIDITVAAHQVPHAMDAAALDAQAIEDIDDSHPERAQADDAAPVMPDGYTDARNRLSSLSCEIVRGSIDHRYTPAAILNSLELARHVRPGSSLPNVLAASACFFLDANVAKPISEELQNNKIHVPSIDVMRNARLRLDLLSVLFAQRFFLRTYLIRFKLEDTSPQLGFIFRCTIEDTFRIPSPHVVSLWQTVEDLDLDKEFSSNHELMSSVGKGRAGLVKTSITS